MAAWQAILHAHDNSFVSSYIIMHVHKLGFINKSRVKTIQLTYIVCVL